MCVWTLPRQAEAKLRHTRSCTHLDPLNNKNNPSEKYHVTGAFLKYEQHLTDKLRSTTHKSMQQSQQDDWFHSFPFQQFQALLALFPKSFSSFPHGTCLLSVSSLCLALDEIYHPLYGPIPRIATLRTCAVHRGLQENTGFSPTSMPFSKRLTLAPPLALCLAATTQDQGPSFQAELIPVHSPLLRESCLVPFPPLTYMLKFSGFADLTSRCAG